MTKHTHLTSAKINFAVLLLSIQIQSVDVVVVIGAIVVAGVSFDVTGAGVVVVVVILKTV